mmetsp:Transcript_59882/g.67830  ORF Transcript_59882/g.67830 Transcript_59882/m.67830 type:complete len:198 (+) Transcript_59882:107-700(+)
MMSTTKKVTVLVLHIAIALMLLATTTPIVFVSSFSFQSHHHHHHQPALTITTTTARDHGSRDRGILYSSSPEDDEQGGLFLGNDIETDNMKKAKADAGEYDFGQIDYLALARQRAAAQVESNNNVANENDWKNLANEKKKMGGRGNDGSDPSMGDDADWENSKLEVGNAESEILFDIGDAGDGGGGGGGGDEPKLLL